MKKYENILVNIFPIGWEINLFFYLNIMQDTEVTCETGLEKNVISEEVYEREMQLCKNLSFENWWKCGWWVCKDCWVLPLLYKLHKGKLLEDPECIKKFKNEILSN